MGSKTPTLSIHLLSTTQDIFLEFVESFINPNLHSQTYSLLVLAVEKSINSHRDISMVVQEIFKHDSGWSELQGIRGGNLPMQEKMRQFIGALMHVSASSGYSLNGEDRYLLPSQSQYWVKAASACVPVARECVPVAGEYVPKYGRPILRLGDFYIDVQTFPMFALMRWEKWVIQWGKTGLLRGYGYLIITLLKFESGRGGWLGGCGTFLVNRYDEYDVWVF